MKGAIAKAAVVLAAAIIAVNKNSSIVIISNSKWSNKGVVVVVKPLNIDLNVPYLTGTTGMQVPRYLVTMLAPHTLPPHAHTLHKLSNRDQHHHCNSRSSSSNYRIKNSSIFNSSCIRSKSSKTFNTHINCMQQVP